jgi:hypothetical protein
MGAVVDTLKDNKIIVIVLIVFVIGIVVWYVGRDSGAPAGTAKSNAIPVKMVYTALSGSKFNITLSQTIECPSRGNVVEKWVKGPGDNMVCKVADMEVADGFDCPAYWTRYNCNGKGGSSCEGSAQVMGIGCFPPPQQMTSIGGIGAGIDREGLEAASGVEGLSGGAVAGIVFGSVAVLGGILTIVYKNKQ